MGDLVMKDIDSEKLGNSEVTARLLNYAKDWAQSVRALQRSLQAHIEPLQRDLQCLSRATGRGLSDALISSPNIADLKFARAEFRFPEHKFDILEEWINEIEWVMQRYRAAVKDPINEKSKPWLEIADRTPAEVRSIIKWLPDPREKRGRRKGSGRVASDKSYLSEMHELVLAGHSPTKAARKILNRRGEKGNLQNKAAYRARLYLKSDLNGKK